MKLLLAVLVPVFVIAAEFKFSNESELSMIQTGGNTELETYNVKTLSTFDKVNNKFFLGGHYTYGKGVDQATDKDVLTAQNWDIFGKYERVFTAKLSGFAQVQVEGDKLSNIDERWNYDLGLKYYFSNTDMMKHFAEVGYRLSTERYYTGSDAEFDRLRFYYEIAKKASETLSWRFWAEYLPNLDNSEDYMITFEPSLALALNKTFSLKAAYRGIYDNVPAATGLERLDWVQTLSLLAKF